MIKVLIADDQALIRESLQIILSAHTSLEVVGTVADGKEVLEKIPQLRPDVILMDIRMPVMDGVLCTKAVKEQYPDIKIIILTTFDDDDFIFSALKYGASGYMLKGVSTEELYQAIQTVYKGGAMINPNIASKVFKIFSQMAQSNFAISVQEENVAEMSQTEWRIIQQVGFGVSNKEIASKLFLSEGTVRNYLSTILAKLNLRDRTQLAIWAVQTGVTTRDFSKENDK
ncbi:response regulator transcription factor [Streptococcus oricebi]|uniref:DNA-binding response regulator n=1 Tax=Streptococcus oricebi TaxID=1547447 RepID=A0ABS5B425_9STRE|nr:response regulator transcription factor [Streptococcus oricebi]MBP2623587.1 DNA-binding response regulator [Streptococcus oricebi]